MRAVEKLVEEWWGHVREAGDGEEWNVVDRPRSERPGILGGWEEHGSKRARTYYRGGKETVTEKGADGKEKKVERSRMGLDADKAWERELPSDCTVHIDQVQRALERVAAGDYSLQSYPTPEHEPHTRVQHEVVLHYTTKGQRRVWAGDRRQREERAIAEAEKAVQALPDEADEGEVEGVLRTAWQGEVERYIRENTAGWTETEREAAVRMAIRESGSMRTGEGLGGEGGRRPGPFVGGGLNGHAMVMDEVLRADTLTRTMLRWDEWEGGTEAMAGGREGGTPVRCHAH